MPSPSDVFVLSAIRATDPAEALRLAVQESGVKPAKVQDLLFGWDGPETVDIQKLARQAGLKCPALTLPSSLRALFFAAQSILCEDAELVLVAGSENGECAALLLGSPAAVGVYNLLPLARIDARSLNGAKAALEKAELAPEDVVELTLKGTCGAQLAVELVGALGETQTRWGTLMVDEAVMLIERL